MFLLHCCTNVVTSVGTCTSLSTLGFGGSTLLSTLSEASPSWLLDTFWMEDSAVLSRASRVSTLMSNFSNFVDSSWMDFTRLARFCSMAYWDLELKSTRTPTKIDIFLDGTDVDISV
jgi:hypothetical protein